EIVRLQARKHQIGLLSLERLRKQSRDRQGVGSFKVVSFDVKCSICALGQCLADGLSRASRTRTEGNYFSSALLLQLQRFFERVSVRLVDFVAQVRTLNPLAGWVDAQLRVARGHLFDGDNNLHSPPS